MRTISVAAIALVLGVKDAQHKNPPANGGPNNKAINAKTEIIPGRQSPALTASPKVKPSRASSQMASAMLAA